MRTTVTKTKRRRLWPVILTAATVAALSGGGYYLAPHEGARFELTRDSAKVSDPVTLGVTVVVTATGSGNFTIPAGVTSILFEAWGSGANGGTTTSADFGGGSGAYISKTLTVTPGDIVYFSVATGNAGDFSWFNLNTNNVATGTGAYQAQSANGTAGGPTGEPTGGVGNQGAADAKFNGASGTAAQGGGGSRGGSGGAGCSGPAGAGNSGAAGVGSAGGAGGSGNAGSGGAGGTAPGGAGTADTSGGGGGAGGSGGGGAGGNGAAPGGGGGGGGSSSGASGTGANGQIRYVYTPAPAFAQQAFQFFNDDGSASASTSAGAQNTNISRNPNTDPNFHLRFRIAEVQGGATAGISFLLRHSINGGAYVTTTTTSSGVKLVDSANLTDGGTLSSARLTGGTGTFVQGEQEETGAADAIGYAANNYSEVLYSLGLVAADLANGDTIDFRVYDNSGVTALGTYTVTPRLTVAAAAATSLPALRIGAHLLPHLVR